MAILLALLSAVAYGVSDFGAGLASRRFAPGPVSGAAQLLGLITAAVAVLLFSGSGPAAAALEWGALSGVGSAIGTLSLYQGLSVASMSVVATLSAVLTAVLPVVVGIALGNDLHAATAVGIAVAIPAIAMVSWQSSDSVTPHVARAGTLYGLLAGVGFALLFIALDRAGTRSGAWPLVPGQVVSLLLLTPFVAHGTRSAGRPSPGTAWLMIGAGVLSGVSNLLFLAATGHGELAVVSVLAALYPAVTVLMARAFLAERWSRRQVVGLLAAVAAIVLVTVG